MTNLEFKINVEINLSENTINWLSALISKAGGILPNPCTVNVPTIPATSEVMPEAKAEANPKGKAEANPKGKAEAKAEAKSKVDLETLRTLLREKVNEHRDELKAKLNELGAANLTVLSPAKYQEMYEYLKSL